MSIGLGIFLSSLFLGTITLYGITKDRWNWRRIGRDSGFGLLAIAVIGGAAFFWGDLRFPIAKQTQYGGLRLGMPQDQVKYVKGWPDEVGSEDGKSVIETTELGEKGKNVEDYREWRYDVKEHHLILSFDPTKTSLIAIECYTIDPLELKRCPKIAGITNENKEQEVIKRFGKPDIASIKSAVKFLNYKNIGVHFILQRGKVFILGINDPGYIPQWWPPEYR